MSAAVATTTKIQIGTAWTGGSAPGAPGTQTVAGTISSAVDVSALFTKVTFSIGVAQIPYTNFASGGWEAFLAGLKDSTLDLDVNQDFAASQTDVLFGLGGTYGPGTTFYMDIMPTSSARGTTNPSTVLQLINLGYGVDLGVGSLMKAPLTLKPTGLPGRLVS